MAAGAQASPLDVSEDPFTEHDIAFFLQCPLGIGLEHTLERPVTEPDLQTAGSIPVDPGHQTIDALIEFRVKPVTVRLKPSHPITAVDLCAVDLHP